MIIRIVVVLGCENVVVKHESRINNLSVCDVLTCVLLVLVEWLPIVLLSVLLLFPTTETFE